MTRDYFTPSLFPQKQDFDPEKFKESCLTSGLEESINAGVKEALVKTNDMNMVYANGDLSLRLHGQLLHEMIFNCIWSATNEFMPDEKIEFVTSIEGNKKCYFRYNDYVFVLRREGVNLLETGPNQVIRDQIADNHVISVSYSLDMSREAVQSLSLQYIEGQNTIWAHNILDNKHVPYVENLMELPEKEHVKARLKPGIKEGIRHESV
jgi:hypothetical protein